MKYNYKCTHCGSTIVNLTKELTYSDCPVYQPSIKGSSVKCEGELKQIKK